MPMTFTPRRLRGRHVQSSSPSMNRNLNTTDSGFISTTKAGGSSPRMTPTTTPLPTVSEPSTTKKKTTELPIQPRTVTPLSFTTRSSTPSWEDYDEGVFGSANRRNKDLGLSKSGSFSQSINASYDDDDEEMPMDEMMDTTRMTEDLSSVGDRSMDPAIILGNPPAVTNIGKMAAALTNNSMERPEGLSLEERMLWDAIQSTIITTSRKAKMDSMAAGSPRETELEMKLAESKTQMEQLNRKLSLAKSENQATTSSHVTVKKINQLEEQLREKETEIKKKELEHDAELRAIQRVLAEMSSERDEETQQLDRTIATLKSKVETLEKENDALQHGMPPPPPPPLPVVSSRTVVEDLEDAKKIKEQIEGLKNTIRDLEAEKTSLKKEIDRKTRRISLLERDFKVLKVQLKKVEAGKPEPETDHPNVQMEALKAELEKLKDHNQKLQVELDAANKDRKARRKIYGHMTPPRPDITSHSDGDSVTSSMSAEDVESLQKNLCETTSSLENAKKIIASLENANGSMAMELRAKLKAKEDELVAVQKEAAERKRRLDSLATELRDLQKKQDDIERLESQSKAQLVRHKALVGLLEKSVSGLQAASAVHEVTTATGEPDKSNVDQISEILNDVMIGIRTSLEMSEQYIDEFDDETTVAFTDIDVSSEVGRHIDAIIKNDREALAKNLKDELEQKKIAVRRLEEALQKQNEEIRRLRLEQRNNEDNQQLLAEIQSLREQCSTNLDVIAKKERELSVLRSSLKVDDADGGYISDDASEGDDENDTTMSPTGLNGYGPEQTEALATLLAAGGSMPDRDGEVKQKLLNALREKDKAMKELQSERESLANAKLIISSLEKSNKSMMEDLRARLQDSNAAISSLLDKSVEHEKNSNALREQVDKLSKEKERLERELEKVVPKVTESTETISTNVRHDNLDPASEEKKEELEATS